MHLSLIHIFTVPLKANFTYNVGNACYGTFFHCEEVKATESGEVDTSKLGSYTVVYTYEYESKTFEKEQTVEVVDLESPIIEVVGEEPLTYCANHKGYGLSLIHILLIRMRVE